MRMGGLWLWVMGIAFLTSACVVSVPTDSKGQPIATTEPPTSAEDLLRRARIRTELAASYYQQRNYVTALEEIRQAVSIKPDYAPAHGIMGLIRMDLGENALAEEAFNSALKYAPKDPELKNNYGWFLCRIGRESEALSFFRDALADPLYRTPALAMSNAGVCSMRLNDDLSAENWFRRALQSDPNQAQAMFHLAELNARKRDWMTAQALVQRFNRTYNPSAESLWLELRVARALGSRVDEASLAAQLKRRFPDSEAATRLKQGRYDE